MSSYAILASHPMARAADGAPVRTEAVVRSRSDARPARASSRHHAVLGLALLALAFASTGCSIKRMAVNSMANSLTSGPDVYAADNDPELVRDAVPFGLKLMEQMLTISPDHPGLLLGCCKGYTSYAYAFVQLDADSLETIDRARASALRDRALNLYLRARAFGLRGLERRQKGISEQLLAQPDQAVAKLEKKDVPLMFWTAAAWGSAISVGKDRPELAGDAGSVRALLARALALDESYDLGALHEAFIVLEALPEVMGGSNVRARQHFDRAVALSHGEFPGPFVTMAENVAVPAQDRAGFDRLLHQALDIDPEKHPENRLQTLVTQRKARILLSRADDLFLESDTTHVEESR